MWTGNNLIIPPKDHWLESLGAKPKEGEIEEKGCGSQDNKD